MFFAVVNAGFAICKISFTVVLKLLVEASKQLFLS